MSWLGPTWVLEGAPEDHPWKREAAVGPPAGNWVDHNPAANALGCSATWFKPHPEFARNGLFYTVHGEKGLRAEVVAPGGDVADRLVAVERSPGVGWWSALTTALGSARSLSVGRSLLASAVSSQEAAAVAQTSQGSPRRPTGGAASPDRRTSPRVIPWCPGAGC